MLWKKKEEITSIPNGMSFAYYPIMEKHLIRS